MADQNTQITVDHVTQAGELLTDHLACAFDNERMACGMALPAEHGYATFTAAHLAEVLAAAGLLPTTTEWGVRYEADRDRTVDESRASEDDARRDVAASPTDTGLISRPAHDWKDA